jgi:LysM repeat protein
MTKKRKTTMNKTLKMVLALTILTGLTACDSRTAGNFKEERSVRQYQAAMNDLSAGRIDAAVAGLEKVIRENPGNASARFQLACLLQDSRHDNLGAICNFREYLLLAPTSDKASMARERISICERRLADELLKRLNLSGNREIAEESERLRKDLAASESERERLSAELTKAQTELTAQRRENERLRRMMASLENDGEEAALQAKPVSVVDLLDNEGADGQNAELAEARKLDAEAEAEDESVQTASLLLPTQAPDAKEKKETAQAERKAIRDAAAKKAEHPDTYVVQEGDTLYMIANRFYGRTSAWKAIREANKEIIGMDGRVRAGQTIKLPR